VAERSSYVPGAVRRMFVLADSKLVVLE